MADRPAFSRCRAPLSVALSMVLWTVGTGVGTAAAAAPEDTAAPTESAAPSEADAPSDVAGPQTVQEAAEAGDLSAAVELAREARKADPTPANWHAEAKALEDAGRYAEAAATYQSELDALPADAEAQRAEAKAARQRTDTLARGTVSGEPASTHREELDAKRQPKAGTTSPRKSRRAVEPPPPRRDGDRIVTKWYFWVTVGAIVASAAAVTGIAIKAARDDEPDALGLQPRPSMGPTLLRF